MKCNYSRHFSRYKFNSEKNTLETSLQQISTELEYKTCTEYRKYFWFMFRIMIGFLIVMWSLVIAVGISTNFQGTDYSVGWICCIPLSIIFVVVCMYIGVNGYDIDISEVQAQKYFDSNAEYKELIQHNAQELIEMERWRLAHPFEEKVRKALESKNGNDVAQVIKMILDKETM